MKEIGGREAESGTNSQIPRWNIICFRFTIVVKFVNAILMVGRRVACDAIAKFISLIL